MIDQMDDGLRAAIKALDEVVAPALDKSNPLAVEQLRLVSRFLGFVRARIDVQAERDRFELRHQLALARELAALQTPGVAEAAAVLAQAIAQAEPLLQRDSCSQHELRAGIDALTAAIAVLVRSVAVADEARRRPIERAIVIASRALLDVQRAWFLPIGFEPDPDRVPPLAQALAAVR